MAALTGIGFFAGGALAALSSPRAVYVAAGVGGLAVLLVTALRLRGVAWSELEPPARANVAVPGHGPNPE
jgi:hypothetical protein